MRRTIRGFAVLVAAVVSALPAIGDAQTDDGPVQTPQAVREHFARAGYDVDRLTTWYTDGVSTFTVRDARRSADSTDRVFMVLVYPDLDSAARQRAAADRLVPGYGPGEWLGNVVVVQSTQRDLGRLFMRDDMDLFPVDALAEAEQYAGLPRVDSDVLAVLRGPARADL